MQMDCSQSEDIPGSPNFMHHLWSRLHREQYLICHYLVNCCVEARKLSWLNWQAQRLFFCKWADIHTASIFHGNRIPFCSFCFKVSIKWCQKTTNKRGEKSYLKDVGRKIPTYMLSQKAKKIFSAKNSLKLAFIWEYLEDTTKCKSLLIASPGNRGRFCCMKSFPLWKSMTGERSCGEGKTWQTATILFHYFIC